MSRLEEGLRSSRQKPALVAYLTAGFPSRAAFPDLLDRVAEVADVVEVGVPFSDPMADGLTIQRTSRQALADGTTLPWILEVVGEKPRTNPIVLMGYLNPFLAYGFERLAEDAARVGVSGLIVPDLPLEESAWLGDPLRDNGVDLVQLVSPVTPDERLSRVVAASRGFVYAVTQTGTTGGEAALDGVADFLGRVRAATPLPLCAGFGIRRREQVAALAPYCDGVIVGSALLAAIEQGLDPVDFLRGLR